MKKTLLTLVFASLAATVSSSAASGCAYDITFDVLPEGRAAVSTESGAPAQVTAPFVVESASFERPNIRSRSMEDVFAVVSLQVDEQGNPHDVKIVDVSDHAITSSVLSGMRFVRFQPALDAVSGEPIVSEIQLRVDFPSLNHPTDVQAMVWATHQVVQPTPSMSKGI